MIEKLREIILQHTEDKDIIITENTILLTDLGLDSYALIQLANQVEEEFGVEIPDRKIGTFKSVQNIVDYLTDNSQKS